MYALIDISNQMLEDSAFDHAWPRRLSNARGATADVHAFTRQPHAEGAVISFAALFSGRGV